VGSSLIIVMLARSPTPIIEGPGLAGARRRSFGFFALSVAALAVLLAYEPRRAEP